MVDYIWPGLPEGVQIVFGTSGDDTFGPYDQSVHVQGKAGSDVIWGSDHNDWLFGDIVNFLRTSDTNTIHGRGGDDIIYGGTGNDILYGDDGNDLIVGGEGSDVIVGGKGADVLFGGDKTLYINPNNNGGTLSGHWADSAPDRFVFNAGDSGVGSANRDVIRGFTAGADKIDLTSMGPNLDFKFGAFAGSNVLVQIDADHNGSYEMQIVVVMKYGQTPADFSLADFITI